MMQATMNADMCYAEDLLQRDARLRHKAESRIKKSPPKPMRLAKARAERAGN